MKQQQQQKKQKEPTREISFSIEFFIMFIIQKVSQYCYNIVPVPQIIENDRNGETRPAKLLYNYMQEQTRYCCRKIDSCTIGRARFVSQDYPEGTGSRWLPSDFSPDMSLSPFSSTILPEIDAAEISSFVAREHIIVKIKKRKRLQLFLLLPSRSTGPAKNWPFIFDNCHLNFNHF